jgi:hypothetical protein
MADDVDAIATLRDPSMPGFRISRSFCRNGRLIECRNAVYGDALDEQYECN